MSLACADRARGGLVWGGTLHPYMRLHARIVSGAQQVEMT